MMPTNGELKALLDQLMRRMNTYDEKQNEASAELTQVHQLLDERTSYFQEIQKHVSTLDERMKTLEDRVLPVLTRVDEFFKVWKRVGIVGKRCALFIAGVATVQFLAWLIPHLLGR